MTAQLNPILPESVKRPRGRPMLPVRGLMSVLDKTYLEVWKLIDNGDLSWVFDVSLQPGIARRRELRILADCAADYAEGRECALSLDQVFELLIPHGEPVLVGDEIEHCLNISDLHLSNLAERKLLNRCDRGHRGIGGESKFTRTSFTSFLTSRRVV